VAQTGSIISGMAARYAGSLFDLAAEAGSLDEVEKELGRVEAMLNDSADLRRLVASPVFSAEDQLRAISAIADRAGFKGLVGNFLRVVARNRRLFALPGMIAAFRKLAAEARGEIAATVTSAHALSPQQETELKQTLKSVAGKDVVLNLTVDPSILGGMIVRIGSRQIDTSLKTKLNSLKLALKEVG
jgi:F-type H+-transporting ATPase subunit delta